MATEQNESGELLKSENPFRKKAFRIIIKMMELNYEVKEKTQKDASALVEEILHGIFFLGELHDPPFPPESILEDDENVEHTNLLKRLKSCYPRPFQLYSSQLPTRSPFSCVLDMMVKLVGQENEEEIRRRLQKFINEVEGGVKSKHLISTAICVSQKSDTSVRHYGVSMSTSGSNAGRIMVAASCLYTWDEYVAGAVLTDYSEEKDKEEEEKKKKQEKKEKKEKKEKSKKSYFNGTIKIPNYVRCQAFNLRNGREMNPCRSCSNLFGLNTVETDKWPYGNCAEAESLSNLLKNETEVKEKTQIIPDMWTHENVERVRKKVLLELVARLSKTRFQLDIPFFNPQRTGV